MADTYEPIEDSRVYPSSAPVDENLEPVPPQDVYGANYKALQPKPREVPVIGYDGVPSYYQTVQDPPEDDAVLKLKYGNHFDDTSTFGHDFAADALNMAVLGYFDTNEKRQQKFQEWYPQGEIKFVEANDNKYAIARREPTEPFRRINGWNLKLPSAVLNVPTVAGLATAPLTGGLGIIPGILSETAITAGGAAIQEGIMQQLEDGRPSNALLQGVGEGVFQFGASVLMRGGPLGVVLSDILGKNKVTPGAKAAFEAQQRQGLVPLTRGQFSSDPGVQAMYAQTTGMDQDALEAALKPFQSLGKDGLKAYIDKNGLDGVSKDVLEALQKQQLADIDSTIAGLKTGSISFAEGSKALSDTLELYRGLGKKAEDAAYAEARKWASEGEWDLEATKKLAEELRTGTLARGKTDPVTGEYAGDVPLDPATGAFRRILDDIDKLDPTISKYAASGKDPVEGLDQLMKLRTKLRGLKDSTTDTALQAKMQKLYSSLTSTITNPSGIMSGDITSGKKIFKDLWEKANKMYAFNRQLDELGPIVNLDNADPFKYAQFARNLVKPENADSLLFLRDIIQPTDPAKWDTMRSSFVNFITEDPVMGAKLLDDYHKGYRTDALRTLVSEKEEETIRGFMKSKEAVESSPLWKAQEMSDLELGHKALYLATSGTPEELQTLVALSGGVDSPTAKSMKAGIVQDWYNSCKVPSEYTEMGEEVIDATKFRKLVEAAKSDGRLDLLFSPSDWRWLQDMENYSIKLGSPPITGEGKPVGAALAAGAQGTKNILAVDKYLRKGPEGLYEARKVPIHISVIGRLLGLNKPVTKLPKSGSATTRKLVNTLSEVGKRVPTMLIESADNIHYQNISQDNVYTP